MTRFELVRRAILAELTLLQKVLVTGAAIALPTLLRALLGSSANPVPFVTFFPAVMLTAVILGWRWAAGATLVSAVIINRVFLAHPWLEHPRTSDIAVLIFFGLSCAVLILTGDTLRRMVRETERFARERNMLSGELYHRVQNVLSVVSALVQMGRADDVDQFRDDLIGRVQALSKANRFLLDKATDGGDVADLIGQAVAPFRRAGAMTLDGPPCTLPALAAYQLVLVLHEFCTNALKHGALSVQHGKVHVSWTGNEEPFRLQWRESGGPPVAPPARKGLGSRLLASQGIFAIEVQYEPEGVCGSIVLLDS